MSIEALKPYHNCQWAALEVCTERTSYRSTGDGEFEAVIAVTMKSTAFWV
jgi:hypothetical protein